MVEKPDATPPQDPMPDEGAPASPPQEDRFVQLALDRGMITAEQVGECRRARDSSPSHRSIQAYLTDRGYLGEEERQVLESLLKMEEAARKAGPAPSLRTLGPYLLRRQLGRGGMGVVYLAEDSRLGREVAIKVLVEGEGIGPTDLQRFLLEARTAAKLSHPNIIAIYDVGTIEDAHYFTMDYIKGRAFDELIADAEVPLSRRCELLRDIAFAVHHAHENGVIHRDLKPSNILLDTEGRPFLMDFGLAKEVVSDRKLTVTGITLGTPSYMSPEQARGEMRKLDARSDVYSLGAVLYEALALKPPFESPSDVETIYRVVTQDPAPPRKLNPQVPRDLNTICLRCLQKDPARRFATSRELAEDLDRYLKGEAIRAAPISTVYRLRRKVARHRAVVGVFAACLLLGGVLALVAWWRAWHAPEETPEAAYDPALRARAQDLYRKARYLGGAAAVAKLGEAIETDPTYDEPYVARARLLWERAELEGALRDLDRALELAERHHQARLERLALCLLELKDSDRVSEDCRWFEREEPETFGPLARAYLALSRQQEELAKQLFTKGLETNDDDAWSWFGLALCQQALGESPQESLHRAFDRLPHLRASWRRHRATQD